MNQISKTKRKNKNYSLPQQEPNQSTKSIKNKVFPSMYTNPQRKVVKERTFKILI